MPFVFAAAVLAGSASATCGRRPTPPRARPGGAGRRGRTRRLDLSRERRPVAADPERGDHRRPHRPRQPPQLTRRPQAATARRAAAGRERDAAPLRPRRLQGLQRHLRPPRRRRAARRASAPQLASAVEPDGRAYRLGGDEFCVLLDARARADDPTRSSTLPRARSCEQGEGFPIGASLRRRRAARRGRQRRRTRCSSPTSACTPTSAARATAAAARRATCCCRCCANASPSCTRTPDGVAELAAAVGRRLASTSAEQLDEVARAAELHDVGKIAIPDAILHKPGRARRRASGSCMRQHTIIGERILARRARAAPGRAARAREPRALGRHRLSRRPRRRARSRSARASSPSATPSTR